MTMTTTETIGDHRFKTPSIENSAADEESQTQQQDTASMKPTNLRRIPKEKEKFQSSNRISKSSSSRKNVANPKTQPVSDQECVADEENQQYDASTCPNAAPLDEQIGDEKGEAKVDRDDESDRKEPEFVLKPEGGDNADEEPARLPFPKAFFDPITNKIMLDPVVLEDGLSYERKDAIDRGEDENLMYPNRALKGYIESELNRYGETGTVIAAIQQWSQSLRSGWQWLVEKSALPKGECRPLPDLFYCPITFDLIFEPVIDPEGHTYEKAAIIQWILSNRDSPVTRQPLTFEQLRPNKALEDILIELSEENGIQPVHPSVKRWKEEKATRPLTPMPEPGTTAPESSSSNQQQQPTIEVTFQRYANSREELEAIERNHRQRTATMIGILACCLLVFFFAPSYFILFMLLLIIISIMYAPQMVRQRQQDERRRELIAEALRQHQELQLQQQRLQQEEEEQQPQRLRLAEQQLAEQQEAEEETLRQFQEMVRQQQRLHQREDEDQQPQRLRLAEQHLAEQDHQSNRT